MCTMILLRHLYRRLSKVKCVRPTSLMLQITFIMSFATLCYVISATNHLDIRNLHTFHPGTTSDFISAGVMTISQMSSLCTHLGPAFFQQGLFLLKDSMGIFRVRALHPLMLLCKVSIFHCDGLQCLGWGRNESPRGVRGILQRFQWATRTAANKTCNVVSHTHLGFL